MSTAKIWIAANVVLLIILSIETALLASACCSSPPAISCPPQPCQSVPSVEHFGGAGLAPPPSASR